MKKFYLAIIFIVFLIKSFAANVNVNINYNLISSTKVTVKENCIQV